MSDKLSGMETPEQLKQQGLKEKRLTVRLQMAASRVEAAEQERIWAIAAAHAAGLSIRKIAADTGLSSSRVHLLLHTDEAKQIAQPLSALNKIDSSIEEQSPNPGTLARLRFATAIIGGSGSLTLVY